MADFIETQGTLHDKNHLFKCQVITAKTNPFIWLRRILSLTLNPATNLKFYYFPRFLMNSWLDLVLSGLFSLPCAVSMLRCRLLARSCAKWRNHFRVSPEKGMKKWRRVRNRIQENQNRFCYEEFICDRWRNLGKCPDFLRNRTMRTTR